MFANINVVELSLAITDGTAFLLLNAMKAESMTARDDYTVGKGLQAYWARSVHDAGGRYGVVADRIDGLLGW